MVLETPDPTDTSTLSLSDRRPLNGCLKYKTQQQSLAHAYPIKLINCCCCEAERQAAPHVSFTDVQTRYYNTILSDHPSVSNGPPIGLGWTLEGETALTVEDHLATANPIRRRLLRNQSLKLAQMKMNKFTRVRLLSARGYTLAEMRKAEREAQRIQASRRKHAQRYPAFLYPVVSFFVEQQPVKATIIQRKRRKQQQLAVAVANRNVQLANVQQQAAAATAA